MEEKIKDKLTLKNVAEYSILLKITQGEAYSFFASNELMDFVLGTRNCALTVKAPNVENHHIRFRLDGSKWTCEDISSAGNVRLGKRLVGHKLLKIGEDDILYIYPPKGSGKTPSLTIEVLKNIRYKYNPATMSTIDLTKKSEYIVGRDETCDIVVNNPRVERKHCRIVYDETNCFIEDLHTISGTFVNNRKTKATKLNNYDRISIAGAAYIYYDFTLLSSKSANGIEISAIDVEKTVTDSGNRRKTVQLLDRVTMTVKAGEFVAVVGGSGAGKSTLMDCLTGVRPASAGKILYDGNDYYENINSYRGVVGIVPQRDIMHDDLTVFKALCYTARIRMRSEVTKTELTERVNAAIADVNLTGKEGLKISMLSGGQKKRVSIAMELLAEPKVIFLDEPTSGLSPDLDAEMMELLRTLTRKGRTIIIITHAMDNIDCCDRVAFLGRGGRLCFFDSPDKLFSYFKLNSFAKIFSVLGDEQKAMIYADKFRANAAKEVGEETTSTLESKQPTEKRRDKTNG